MELDGKVVIVTGASGGIRIAICQRLSSEGAIVTVNYRANAGQAEELAAALRNFGREAQPFQADVSKLEDGRRLVVVTAKTTRKPPPPKRSPYIAMISVMSKRLANLQN